MGFHFPYIFYAKLSIEILGKKILAKTADMVVRHYVSLTGKIFQKSGADPSTFRTGECITTCKLDNHHKKK